MSRNNGCAHPKKSWGSWYEVQGVTHALEVREQTCDSCGKVTDRQQRQGRKY